jgi:hypothetical protein
VPHVGERFQRVKRAIFGSHREVSWVSTLWIVKNRQGASAQTGSSALPLLNRLLPKSVAHGLPIFPKKSREEFVRFDP